jgi:predicted Zn-dependent peptidase
MAGITHFIDGLAFQGTTRRSVRELTEAFEDLGARYDASAGTELLWYTALALGRDLERIVPLIVEVARYPLFDPGETEKVRDRQLQELAGLEDEPMQKVLEVLQREFFLGHRYGNSVLGDVESVKSISVQDLQGYWQASHHPNATIFAAAGKLDFTRLVDAVEKACADWPSGITLPLHAPPAYEPRTMVIERESHQQHIGIGVQGVPVGDDDYYATALLSTVLGGSMNSRLFTEVREKRGLAYGVGAYPLSLRDAGMIRIYAGTVPEKAYETVAVTLGELQKLEQDGVQPDELERAKTVLKSRLIMAGENTRVRRSAIGSSLWYEGRVRTLDEIRSLIDAVTLDQIGALANRLEISSRYTVAAIGPCTAEELLRNVN